MKKTKKLMLNVMGMFLLFSVLVNSVYAKDNTSGSSAIADEKISVIKSDKQSVKIKGVGMSTFSGSSFKSSGNAIRFLLKNEFEVLGAALAQVVEEAVLKDGLKKTYGTSIKKIETFDWDTYITNRLVKQLSAKGISAEFDNTFQSISLDNAKKNPMAAKQRLTMLAMAKHELVFLYSILQFDILGNKKLASADLEIYFALNFVDKKLLQGKSVKEMVKIAKAQKKAGKKSPINWHTNVYSVLDVIPPEKANELYPVFMKMVNKAVDKAVDEFYNYRKKIK